MRDLIIIGGGAAGLSAAMYALGKQLDFLIIYETFGKAGTAQHLIGQEEEEYLAGSEAVVDKVISDLHLDTSEKQATTNRAYFNSSLLGSGHRPPRG